MPSTYFNYNPLLLFDGDVAYAEDVNDITRAVDTALESVEADIDAILSTVSQTISGTSTTTLTPSLAEKVVTTQSGKSFDAGTFIMLISSSNSAVWMYGPVTSYVGTTLTFTPTVIGTALEKSDWVVAGRVGARGATGLGITEQTTGFTLSGGTTPKTLTVVGDVSTADLALLNSPTFTGIPVAPTAATGTNTTQLATTAFVTNSPTLITPALGIPASGTLTNCIGLPASGVVGTSAILGSNTFTGLQTLAAGSNIVSAATIDLTAATGNSPRITGTTPTSAVTMNTGQKMTVVADGEWPLTYHATTNKINTGGANYTCAAGDVVLYYKDLSGVVHGTIFPASGQAVVASGMQSQLVSTTRNVATTGVQSITGVAFTPTAAIIQAVIPNTIAVSWGIVSSSGGGAALNHDQPTADNAFSFQISPIFLYVSSGNYAEASVGLTASGCDLTWSKVGLPTGTATIQILFLR